MPDYQSTKESPEASNEATRRIIKFVLMVVRTRHEYEASKERPMTAEEAAEYSAIMNLIRINSGSAYNPLCLWVKTHSDFFERFNIEQLNTETLSYHFRGKGNDYMVLIELQMGSTDSKTIKVHYLK